MEARLSPLLPLYERERAGGRAAALAIVVDTSGSTYRKPGALMLIAADGDSAGLLSGGCLEGDLREHARGVIATGEARTISYDTHGPDDLLWGLGLGCEGAMRIFLMRVGAEEGWQPLEHFAAAHHAHTRTAVAIVVESPDRELRPGSVYVPGDGTSPRRWQSVLDAAAKDGRTAWIETAVPGARVFALPLALPPRVLLLGAGPDALPVAELGARLGWKMVVADHRPAYARSEHFPAAECVALREAAALAAAVDPTQFDAAIVMSHHLPSDLSYLSLLAESGPDYVGLLGPPARRERLLEALGPAASRLAGRLHAPAGLDLGGRGPESIALSIVAEIHAHLHGALPSAARGARS